MHINCGSGKGEYNMGNSVEDRRREDKNQNPFVGNINGRTITNTRLDKNQNPFAGNITENIIA